MNILNTLLGLAAVVSVLFVLSGYKEEFVTMPDDFKNPTRIHLCKKVKKKKPSCRPVFNCRRVGYFCSKIN